MDSGKLISASKAFNVFYMRRRCDGMSVENAHEQAVIDVMMCFTLDSDEHDSFTEIVSLIKAVDSSSFPSENELETSERSLESTKTTQQTPKYLFASKALLVAVIASFSFVGCAHRHDAKAVCTTYGHTEICKIKMPKFPDEER